MNIVLTDKAAIQPPVFNAPSNELTIAIASLSIGGAERIVLDWASRIYPAWRVHLIVLRTRDKEWPVPSFVRITRVEDSIPPGVHVHKHRLAKLRELGTELKKHPNPTCTCHLLRKDERDALGSSGAEIITVVHNAKDGWAEDAHLMSSDRIIAVSAACARELKECGVEGPISVIRHIPLPTHVRTNTRSNIRRSWNIPDGALVIGMIGAVKAQKNYARALHILKQVLAIRDAYLVIVGGPLSSPKGRDEWKTVLDGIHSLGLRNRVAMPGFIADPANCLPAFDVLINCSHFEGLSMATLEALQTGLPVIASAVGGQGEIASPGLELIGIENSDEIWARRVAHFLGKRFDPPSWAHFKSHRLWTLAALAHTNPDSGKVLFVTANLNVGGAQRSLVNLALGLRGLIPFKIAVAGNSTESYFYERLRDGGVEVVRLSAGPMSFTNSEALVALASSEGIRTICFWNLDPKIKLLAAKSLGHTDIKLIDVSPGDNSFDELAGESGFQKLIAYSEEELYSRLNVLVTKFDRPGPEKFSGELKVIRNGVPPVVHQKIDYSISGAPRIVVNGRIAPTKFLLEIIESMRFVRRSFPLAELHIFGAAETLHEEYAQNVQNFAAQAGATFFHGLNFEASESLRDYDVYVVIGKDQGCPNALLEAMAAGMPCVANNDGGTAEQLHDGKTGLLTETRSPQEIADAVVRLLEDRKLAEQLGNNARRHVLSTFSMDTMVARYLELFQGSQPSNVSQTSKGEEAYETTESCPAGQR